FIGLIASIGAAVAQVGSNLPPSGDVWLAPGATGPLAVVRTLAQAQTAADVDAALALFAGDAVIVNVAGMKFAGEDLRSFLAQDAWINERFSLEEPRVAGDKVTWTRSVTAPFYERLGIAPVQFAFEATVHGDKIKSIVAYLPPGEIARI